MSKPAKPLPEKAIKILFITSEIRPLVKTGGLADVSGALPPALTELGVDIRILIPGYPSVMGALKNKQLLARITTLPGHGEIRLLGARMPDTDVPIMVVDYPAYYDRPGSPYQDEDGRDWSDNDWRFSLLSRIGAILSSHQSPLPWRPDIAHCNDWQSGLTPAYLHYVSAPKAHSIMTIHNLAYQGIFSANMVPLLGLPAQSFHMQGAEYYGNFSFLKAGLFYADHITTVSPTYAKEIQSETLGFGLQGLLFERRAQLTGILNGIDDTFWDPARDPYIHQTFDQHNLAGKTANKRALQLQLGLQVAPEIPLLAVVSRITHQKGLDILLEIAPSLLDEPTQIVLLGSGEVELEQSLLELAQEYPGKISVVIGYDEHLAHQIEAGADIFLMPSRFEPCGLNQMYSQRYGTPPVVRATGGLADTVTDATPQMIRNSSATGFVFSPLNPATFLAAIMRATTLYRDKNVWQSIQLNGMQRDFSWKKSAAEYRALYASVANDVDLI